MSSTRPSRARALSPSIRARSGTASRQRDPFTTLYADRQVIPPPFSYAALAEVHDASDALFASVAAMETNISAFGWQLVPVDKDRVAAEKDAAEAERARLAAWLRYMHVDGSLVALRRQTRVDVEVYGDGYWEVLRDARGEISGVAHMRAHFVRKGPLSRELVEVDRFVQEPDGTWRTVKQLRRFRCFAQIVEGVPTWFKTLGDPRPIRADTGAVDASAAPQDLASEVVNFSLYAPDSPYGKPRWRGAAEDAIGRAKAGQVNGQLFDNKAIPPFLILVQNALLGDGVVDRIKEHFEATKGRENYNAPLIIEAESSADPMGEGASAPVKIDVKDLTEGVHKDALFGNYRSAASDAVAGAFRLPRILVGRGQDYNRATAEAAKTVAEEQVFGPERAEEDEVFNREILPRLDARYWRVHTNPPPSLDDEQVAVLLRVALEAGVLTPESAAQVLGPLLGVDLSRTDAWHRVPSKVLALLVAKGWVPEGLTGLVEPAKSEPTTGEGSDPAAGEGSDPDADAETSAAPAKPAG